MCNTAFELESNFPLTESLHVFQGESAGNIALSYFISCKLHVKQFCQNYWKTEWNNFTMWDVQNAP